MEFPLLRRPHALGAVAATLIITVMRRQAIPFVLFASLAPGEAVTSLSAVSVESGLAVAAGVSSRAKSAAAAGKDATASSGLELGAVPRTAPSYP